MSDCAPCAAVFDRELERAGTCDLQTNSFEWGVALCSAQRALRLQRTRGIALRSAHEVRGVWDQPTCSDYLILRPLRHLLRVGRSADNAPTTA